MTHRAIELLSLILGNDQDALIALTEAMKLAVDQIMTEDYGGLPIPEEPPIIPNRGKPYTLDRNPFLPM